MDRPHFFLASCVHHLPQAERVEDAIIRSHVDGPIHYCRGGIDPAARGGVPQVATRAFIRAYRLPSRKPTYTIPVATAGRKNRDIPWDWPTAFSGEGPPLKTRSGRAGPDLTPLLPSRLVGRTGVPRWPNSPVRP